jgi:hypothetical protein
MTGKSDVKRYRGGCLCGAVTFEVALPATFVGHCHCSMCRRAHGAAYVTWVGVPVGMFYLTKGKETLVDYQSSDHVTRSFCGRCGSPMFCNDARHAEAAHLTLASLQGDTGLIPEAHYFFDSRADWTKVHDDLPKLGGKSGLMPL